MLLRRRKQKELEMQQAHRDRRASLEFRDTPEQLVLLVLLALRVLPARRELLARPV